MCFMSSQEEPTILLKHFFSYFSTLLISLFTHQPPQALTWFYLGPNWKQQNRVVSEGIKRARLLAFCSFRESVSLLRSQYYKRQPATGLRGDILSSSLACIRWNNPFLYGLVLPGPPSERSHADLSISVELLFYGPEVKT